MWEKKLYIKVVWKFQIQRLVLSKADYEAESAKGISRITLE